MLEGALRLKKDFYVHTLRTLDLLAADAAANGETESSTAGLRISAEELQCQVGPTSPECVRFRESAWNRSILTPEFTDVSI